MGQRERVRMNDAEVTAFLRSQRTVQIATLRGDGAPHLSTLWYGFERRNLAFWTYRRSVKAQNLRRDPRIAALVEDGDTYGALRGVSISGRAEVVDDAAEVERIALAIASRNPMSSPERIRSQVAKRVAVVIHPDSVASWDHRKLVGRT